MVTDMEKIIRNEIRRPLPVVRRDTNIPLISPENYEIMHRELFSRPRKAAPPVGTVPRKDKSKKE